MIYITNVKWCAMSRVGGKNNGVKKSSGDQLIMMQTISYCFCTSVAVFVQSKNYSVIVAAVGAGDASCKSMLIN